MTSHFLPFTNRTSIYSLRKAKVMANESSVRQTVQTLEAVLCTVTEPRGLCEPEKS